MFISGRVDLGLGLVVPAIAASGVPFAVQRPKPRWEQLFANSEEIDVSVNGEVKMKGAQVLAAHKAAGRGTHERPPRNGTSYLIGLRSFLGGSSVVVITSDVLLLFVGCGDARVMTSTLSALLK